MGRCGMIVNASIIHRVKNEVVLKALLGLRAGFNNERKKPYTCACLWTKKSGQCYSLLIA